MLNELWTSNILFLGLTDDQLKTIEPYIREIEYAPGEVIMKEGEPGAFVFMIDAGSVSVKKNELILSQKLPGDLVGLMSLIDLRPRSATVLAGPEGASGFLMTKSGFDEIIESEQDSIVSTMLLNYTRDQQNVIRNTNALSLEATRSSLDAEASRSSAARFFIQMTIILFGLFFGLAFLFDRLYPDLEVYFWGITIVSLAFWSIAFEHYGPLSLDTLRFHHENPLKALKWSMAAALLFMVLVTLLQYIDAGLHAEEQVFDLAWKHQPGLFSSAGMVTWFLYVLIEEWIARGCIQHALQKFVVGSESARTAILSGALIFIPLYLLIGFKFLLFSVVGGLFWGFLFRRQVPIWMIWIFHTLAGLYAIYVLQFFSWF